MTLHLPQERDLPPAAHVRIRNQLVAEIERAANRQTRPYVRRRPILVALTGVTLIVALMIPSIGVGTILRAIGLTQPPQYVVLEQDWRSALTRGAAEDPGPQFANLSPAELRSRLAAAATTYGFRLVSLELLQPKGLAPVITVETTDPARLAAAVPALIRHIDPKSRSLDDRRGWAFEGIFLKALDDQGKPFLVVFNHWRGSDAGGGQWARTEDLLPYVHG